MCGSSFLTKHISHFRELFNFFIKFNISINLKKAFLRYPDINFLE